MRYQIRRLDNFFQDWQNVADQESWYPCNKACPRYALKLQSRKLSMIFLKENYVELNFCR